LLLALALTAAEFPLALALPAMGVSGADTECVPALELSDVELDCAARLSDLVNVCGVIDCVHVLREALADLLGGEGVHCVLLVFVVRVVGGGEARL
jgi:hypothetical protein